MNRTKILNIVVLTVGAMLLSLVAQAAGVPLKMAQRRAEIISNVAYNLELQIPEQVKTPITGKCQIIFDLSEVENIPIDFNGMPEGAELKVSINGNAEHQVVSDEHVIIPATYLREGCNEVVLDFICGDRALNRHDDYLYSLFVPANARSVFPCFDQPDMKATFELALRVPQSWNARSNTAIVSRQPDDSGSDIVRFAKTKPIPTYLMSFIAGTFDEYSREKNGRKYTGYHLEKNQDMLAHLSTVVDFADYAINWLEEYTGVAYPFEKYEFVVLPGYQFGGMEHPGLIQYNDRRVFPRLELTKDDEIKLFNLVCHETAHMWCGDLVTMKWFNDVWTKEAFANFLADKMTDSKFENEDAELIFVRNHYIPAYATDRTAGTHPIQQNLDNLNSAGLLYGNIIYHKAPIMMRKLEEKAGEESLSNAVGEYLKRYNYGNATWDDFVEILNVVAPEAGIMDFDREWVKTAGIRSDVESKERLDTLGVSLPNINGMEYGLFKLSPEEVSVAMQILSTLDKPLNRLALTMTLYENFLMGNIAPDALQECLQTALMAEKHELVALSMADYLLSIGNLASLEDQSKYDSVAYDLSKKHEIPSVRTKLLREISVRTVSPEILEELDDIWRNQKAEGFSEHDYMAMAYHLATMNPREWNKYLDYEKSRLSTSSLVSELDYMAEACRPEAELRLENFRRLIKPENRVNEPWAKDYLALLFCKHREKDAIAYLKEGLDNLEYIKSTSDIFFPGYWLSSLLSQLRTPESAMIVKKWIEEHPDIEPGLLHKILEYSYPLGIR